MKIAIFLLGMSLCFGLIPLTYGAGSADPAINGTINQFSIESRSMLINEKEYNLVDRLQVVNKDNIAAGEMILKNGQSIEFWLETTNKKNKHLEKDKEHLPIIKRIRVLSDVEMNY